MKFRHKQISIHALLAESDFIGQVAIHSIHISIHALLAESDPNADWKWPEYFNISIHALLAESDDKPIIVKIRRKLFLSTLSLRRATLRETVPRGGHVIFLSTLSLRRATCQGQAGSAGYLHFYPRSPCGERLDKRCKFSWNDGISIHALLAESDSARPDIHRPCAISIHALLAESDVTSSTVIVILRNFYPRSPCGERPPNRRLCRCNKNFYPRSPCGERQKQP